MRKVLALTLVLGLGTAAPALGHISLHRAWQLDRTMEAHYLGKSPADLAVHCKLGPRGNAGCTYSYCDTIRVDATTKRVSLQINLVDVHLQGHDAVVRRHGRLHVDAGPWMRIIGRC